MAQREQLTLCLNTSENTTLNMWTWSFQDKSLYFKINNYKTTLMINFTEFDEEI
jgi:hypothetical protein